MDFFINRNKKIQTLEVDEIKKTDHPMGSRLIMTSGNSYLRTKLSQLVVIQKFDNKPLSLEPKFL